MTVGIVGMPQEESEPLLEAVFDHAEKRDFVYEHVWRVGDLLLWDNRCSSHARTRFPLDRTPADAAHHGQGHRAALLKSRRRCTPTERGDAVALLVGLLRRSRRRVLRPASGSGAGLSKKADRTGGAVRCRRHHRQHRPADGAALLRQLGPDRGGQQSPRRRQHDRHQRGRQGAARRPHPSRHHDRLRDQCRPAEAALRSRSGILPPSPSSPRSRSMLVVHASVPAHEPAGVHRASEVEAGRLGLRLLRHRHLAASRRRDVQVHGRHRSWCTCRSRATPRP